METKKRRGDQSMSADINSSELCVKAVRVLKEELVNARKTLMNAETCVVNRATMQAQLEYLEDNLPETVVQAADIVRTQEDMLRKIDEQRTEILQSAQTQAQNMVNDASGKAQSIMEQANYEANALAEQARNEAAACMEAARAEAVRIVEDAEKKAAQLVEEETIVRRARVESEELREKAQHDAATLQQNTLDYMDSLLADADRNLSELINNVRLERNEIRNHR